MNHFQKTILIVFLAGSVTSLFAQQNLVASGGDTATATGSVAWSVGIIAYSTWSDTSGKVTEGVQQPYEIYIMESINEPVPVECVLFPNPSPGKITLRLSGNDRKKLDCTIFNEEGSLLQSLDISGGDNIILLDGYKPATYFLVLSENGSPLRTYKIVKK